MVQIPSPRHLLPVKSSTLLADGSNIYKIGGSDDSFVNNFFKRPYSSSVSVLDCRSHTWHQAPSMSMKRNSSSTASLVDGKIYVAGGCKDKYVSNPNWIEVFDPKTQTWANVKNPWVFELHHEFRDTGFVTKSFELEGKLHVVGDDSAVYNSKEGTWSAIDENRSLSWVERNMYCVIDDVLFFWYEYKGVLQWYDFKVSLWKELKGVEGEFFGRKICKMVDLGGKMAVLWEKNEYTHQNCHKNSIWCAEIVLERRDGDEILGKVEWFGLMLTVPSRDECESTWFNALSASL